MLPLGSLDIGEFDVVDAGPHLACSHEHRSTLVAGSEAKFFRVSS